MSALVAQPQADSPVDVPPITSEEVSDCAHNNDISDDNDDDNLSTSSSLTSPSMASVHLGYSWKDNPNREQPSHPLSIDIMDHARGIPHPEDTQQSQSVGLVDVHHVVTQKEPTSCRNHQDDDDDDDNSDNQSIGSTCSTKNQDKTGVHVELMGKFEPLVITTNRSTAWGLVGNFRPRLRLTPRPRRALQAARLVLARRKMAILIREYGNNNATTTTTTTTGGGGGGGGGGVDEDGEEEVTQHRNDDQEPRYLQLLRQHPVLARDRFRHKVSLWGDDFLIFPLSFCVEVGAPLSVVQEVFEMFPEALSQPVAPLEGDFLLHLACSQLYRTPKDVIMFLAQAYPDGVRKEDLDGFLPLHRLLFRSSASSSMHHGNLTTRNPSLHEVQTLLDIYPNSILQDCFGSPLLLAFDGELERNGNNFQDVFACLISNFPSEARSLELGERIVPQPTYTSANTTTDDLLEAYYMPNRLRGPTTGGRKQYGIMTLEHAHWVSKILPQLTSLCCTPRVFAPRAFSLIMRNLYQHPYLEELDLHVPRDLLVNNETVCSSLYQLLRQTKALTSLKLDFGGTETGNDNKDNNQRALEPCMVSLGKGLCENQTIQMVLILIADKIHPRVLDNAIWKPLARVLRSSNTSLEFISIPQPPSIYGNNETENARLVVGDDNGNDSHSASELLSPPPPAQKRCLHYIRLNRAGRRLARDPYLTKPGFANLLVTSIRRHQCAVQIINQRRAAASSTQQAAGEASTIDGVVMHSILYGLLLESPNCWSGTAGGP